MRPTVAFLHTAPGHEATFSRLVAEIAVVAALESTIEPTTYLLHEVARSREAKFELSTRVCDRAWEHFEHGDMMCRP